MNTFIIFFTLHAFIIITLFTILYRTIYTNLRRYSKENNKFTLYFITQYNYYYIILL